MDNICAAAIEQTLEVRVSHDSDDSEEDDGGAMYLTSTDLELVYDDVNQTVGLRFQDVTVPQGATITSAYVQFQVNQVSTDTCALTIRGQAADDTAAFTTNPNDISSRPMTAVSERWNPPAWNTIGESGPDQRTSDISGVIQEIVSRDGWSSGNSMVIIITGSGTRTAESYGGSAEKAALLHIEYNAPPWMAPSAYPSAVLVERRLQVRVSHDRDDSEEGDGGEVYLTSTDLELVNDGVNQTVGLRFQDVTVPQGVTITSAYIQFHVNEVSTGGCALTVQGQAADDAAAFTTNTNDISSRPMTAVSENWSPLAWDTIGEAGPDQRTSDISGVIQEIVSRDGWNSSNSMAIIITGTGTRTAESYGGTAGKAALLHIEYTALVSDPANVRAPAPTTYEALWEAMRARNLAMEFGVYYYGFNYAQDDDAVVANRGEGDLGFGTGYARIRYVTNPWRGFRLGGAVVGVFNFYQKNQGWAQNPVDRDRYYIPRVQFYYKNAQMYEAFIHYGISKSYVKVGRQKMNSIRFGYDAAEGISLNFNEIDRVSILFESFWRGLEDAGYDEISKWDMVRKHGGRRGEAASDAVFSIQARVLAPGDWLHLTPYFYVQKDFLSALGTRADLDSRKGSMEYGIALDYLKVNEATPYVDYDASWHAFAAQPWVYFAGITAQAGYHKMSSLPEDTVPAYAYWMFNLNPMEDGKRVLQSAADTYYIGMSYEWRRVDVGIQFAKSDSPFGYDAKEWSFNLIYDLTPNISSDLYFINYNDQLREVDYTSIEALLRYSF